MKISVRNWHLTIVDFLVGLAVLMILSALIVPVFIPPEGKAAPRAGTTSAPVQTTQR